MKGWEPALLTAVPEKGTKFNKSKAASARMGKNYTDSRSMEGFCLFDVILYVPSTIFQLNRTGLPGLNQY